MYEWLVKEGAPVPMETGSRYSSQSQMGLCLHCVHPKTYFSFRFWVNLWTRFVFQSELTEIPLMGLLLFCANTKSENTSTISNIVSWSLGRNLSGENSIVLSDTLKSDLEKLLRIQNQILSLAVSDAWFHIWKKSLIKLKTWKLVGLKSPQIEKCSISSSVSILDQTSPASNVFCFYVCFVSESASLAVLRLRLRSDKG